mmetsp:Transcript_41183/g.36512  ORF Transcript_41183/g.36512 Transcript_41183/m.36512 type:complete len:112 (+) Transcript_41183:127-462(+)
MEYEWLPVLERLAPNFEPEDVVPLEYEKSLILGSFSGILNAISASMAFLFPKQEMWSNYTELFLGMKPWVLNTYMRYCALDLFMGGISQTRPIHDLLWGYVDPLLEQFAEQ